MREDAGGAAPREGFEYQDVAAAYFFLTDEPRFRSEAPLELWVEKYDSDFAYYIHYDDHDKEHFFEIKYRGSGDYKLSDFYSTLSEFSKISNEHADPNNTSSYHLVTNASFGTKLDTLLSDAKNLRNRTTTWQNVIDKKLYQRRNENQLKSNTDLDEGELFNLIQGLYGHKKSKERMINSIETYVRNCNSPGKFVTPTKLILQKIGEKSSGVIRRDELAEAADISLTKRSKSSKSSDSRSTEGLAETIGTMADEYSSPDTDPNDIREQKNAVAEFTGRIIDNDDEGNSPLESQSVGLQNDLENLIELKEEEERVKYGISRKADRLIDRTEYNSQDNGDDSDSNI